MVDSSLVFVCSLYFSKIGFALIKSNIVKFFPEKSKINLTSKEINTKEAERIIAEFNKPNVDPEKSKTISPTKNKSKSKKISKK